MQSLEEISTELLARSATPAVLIVQGSQNTFSIGLEVMELRHILDDGTLIWVLGGCRDGRRLGRRSWDTTFSLRFPSLPIYQSTLWTALRSYACPLTSLWSHEMPAIYTTVPVSIIGTAPVYYIKPLYVHNVMCSSFQNRPCFTRG
jgi:hypothetical protein